MAGRESISESSTIEGKHQINRGIQRVIHQLLAHLLSSVLKPHHLWFPIHTGPSSASNRHGFIKLSQLPPESPQRPSSSELLAFSESIKSKFSAASARYKESFSKFT